MKSMTCKQLGGACDKVFSANSFDEIAKMSRDHGTEMFAKKDAEHLAAMNKMRELMHDPNALSAWMESKRKEFNALADD